MSRYALLGTQFTKILEKSKNTVDEKRENGFMFYLGPIYFVG